MTVLLRALLRAGLVALLRAGLVAPLRAGLVAPLRAGLVAPLRAGLVALLAVGALAALPLAAAAHGSLSIPTVRLDARDDTVEVAWEAAADDAVAIAVELGMAPRQALLDHLAALAALDDDADVQPLIDVLIGSVDAEALLGSEALERYLLASIAVQQDDEHCPGEVTSLGRFLDGEATLRFTCPEPVATIALGITLLTEQDPTHRTLSTDGRRDVAVHTRAAPTHTWDLASEGDDTDLAAGLGVLGAGLLGAALTGAGALRVLGRRAGAGR